MSYYSIRNDKYTAVIHSIGANCISLRHESLKNGILREPTSEKKDNPFLYGTPLLFPVNRISNAKFSFDGREYSFPVNEEKTGCHLHGELHQKEFSLISHTEKSLVLALKVKKRQGFMHDFEIRIRYSLSKSGLTQKVTVKNFSDKKMPCMLGFHTTFNGNFAGDGKVSVFASVKEEIERNMQNYLPTGRVLGLDDAGKDLVNGRFSLKTISKHYRADENVAILYNNDKKIKVKYEYDEKYKFRLVYGTKDFICLEPQTCIVDAPNLSGKFIDDGFDFVLPFDKKIYYTKISVKEN